MQLKQSKYYYLQQLVLFTEIQELLLDVERGKVSPQSVRLTSSPELYAMLQQCVVLATAAHHTTLPPTEHAQSKQSSVLGIKPDHLRQIDPRRGALQQHLQSVQQSIIPELESRLKEKCERMVEYHKSPRESPHSERSRGLAFAKATQLPAIIEAEIKQLKEQEEKVQQQRRRTEERFWGYYHVSLQSFLEVSRALCIVCVIVTITASLWVVGCIGGIDERTQTEERD